MTGVDKLRIKLACLEQDVLEQRTLGSLQLDDLKLENIRLKSNARRLENEILQEELFGEYERELMAYHKRIEKERLELVKLFKDFLQENERLQPATKGTTRVTMRELVDIENKAKELRAEKVALEKMERQDGLNQVRIDHKSVFLCSVSRENHMKQQELEAERLRLAELNARAHLASDTVVQLRGKEEELRIDQKVSNDEVENLRVYTALVKKERDQQDILDRFVSKHVSSKVSSLFMPTRVSQDINTTTKLMSKIYDNLDIIETTLLDRCQAQDESPALLIAKIRVEFEKCKDAIYSLASNEEDILNILLREVERNENQMLNQ